MVPRGVVISSFDYSSLSSSEEGQRGYSIRQCSPSPIPSQPLLSILWQLDIPQYSTGQPDWGEGGWLMRINMTTQLLPHLNCDQYIWRICVDLNPRLGLEWVMPPLQCIQNPCCIFILKTPTSIHLKRVWLPLPFECCCLFAVCNHSECFWLPFICLYVSKRLLGECRKKTKTNLLPDFHWKTGEKMCIQFIEAVALVKQLLYRITQL